ncbi:autotransporter domain-containing protein [Maricaulis sp. D1M11]|uniref:autotransporter outer membrane beta-barrel domain-containing protein n=1 Tax=Maricaulis sp. D1M11 TaxID=3076117 RepID=UPI0039B52A56
MRRRFMFASALVSLTVAVPAAFADEEVTDTRETPIATSTAASGSADNIVITSTGRVTLTSAQTAVTLDSDNDVTVDGDVTVTSDEDGGVGVHVVAGNTGTLTINGDIVVESESSPEDEGEDTDTGFADLDGPSAIGGQRVGVLVDGDGAFVGDVILNSSGSLTVRGNDSAALRTLSMIDGNIILDGRTNIVGDNSTGIEIRGDVTGEFSLTGSVGAVGENSVGVHLAGDISGGAYFNGAVAVTGYQFNGRPTNADFLASLDEDDVFQSGSAVLIEASITNGVLFDGPDEANSLTSTNSIAIRGAAPAVHLRAGDANVVIGEAIQPGVEDDPDTEDDESVDPLPLGFSLVNRGPISARGELNDVSATALAIEGGTDADDMALTTELTHGFLNTNTISATAYSDTSAMLATAVRIGNGGILPVFENRGTLAATSITVAESDNFGDAYALIIENGAVFDRLVNDGIISATGQAGGSGFAVVDRSGTLTEVTNSGTIQALHSEPSAFFDDDGNVVTPEDVDHQTVAIDLSANTTGTTIRQYWEQDIVEDDPDTEVDESLNAVRVTDEVIRINGDILLGSGDDTFRLEAGTVSGALAFGDGADTLVLDGRAVYDEIQRLIDEELIDPIEGDELYLELPQYAGRLTDTDGNLRIEMDFAQLTLEEGGALNIDSARFGDGALLIFEVDAEQGMARSINASGDITFEEGSRISVALSNLIGNNGDFTLVSAEGELTVDADLVTLNDTTSPYLYNAVIGYAPDDQDTLVLSLARKSSGELGMSTNQAAAYDAAFATWQSNADLGAAIAGLTTESDFFGAYDQLLPDHSGNAVRFLMAANDIATGALASRLDAARLSPQDSGGLWIQEFGFYADLGQADQGPDFRGRGLGFAAGYDQPVGPFYAAGVNILVSAADIEEIDGFDVPLSGISGQVGVYAGAEFSGWNLDLHGAAGLDWFEHERRIVIGAYEVSPTADWTGYHINGAARFGRDFTFGNYYILPAVAIDYLLLNESDYEESGGGNGVDLFVDSRESQILAGTGVVTFGAHYGDSSSWWSPNVRIGYRNEIIAEIPETQAGFIGFDERFTLLGSEATGNGIIFGLGFNAGSEYSTFALAYDADLRDDYIRHTARLVIRLVF